MVSAILHVSFGVSYTMSTIVFPHKGLPVDQHPSSHAHAVSRPYHPFPFLAWNHHMQPSSPSSSAQTPTLGFATSASCLKTVVLQFGAFCCYSIFRRSKSAIRGTKFDVTRWPRFMWSSATSAAPMDEGTDCTLCFYFCCIASEDSWWRCLPSCFTNKA